MGKVPAPHASPTAPADRTWNWHGTQQARKGDQLLERGWEAFASAHAWYDPALDEAHDPPHEKQAYKLPHHELVDGTMRVVWSGVESAMNVLAGGRGGVDIPDADRRSGYRHLARHYAEFDKTAPAFEDLG